MSKGLEPEDCLRGHQIIPTARIEAMLRREGFELRDNHGGTSHRRYIHNRYHEIALNVIAGTDKRDTQVRAAKAVMHVRALGHKKTPSPHDLWLRQVAASIDSARESYDIAEDALIVTLPDQPLIGMTVPFDVCAATAVQLIETMRRNARDVTQTLDRLGREYGILTETDPDNTLHAYHPAWRTAIHLKPFGETDRDPLVILAGWEDILREQKQVSEKTTALEKMASMLAARWPDDEIVIAHGTVVVRDGAWPEMGITLTLKTTPADIDAKYRRLKKNAHDFAARIGRLENEFEFRTRRGKKRSFYIDHMVYEHMSAVIHRYGRGGDNRKAFDVLARLEEAVCERDKEFKANESDAGSIRIHCKNYTTREQDGLLVHDGDFYQPGTRHRQRIHFVETPQGRRSIAQDSALYQTLLLACTHDFEHAVRAQGFRAERIPGGLRLTHMYYDGISVDMPHYDEVRGMVGGFKALGEKCLHARDFKAVLAEYVEAQKRTFDGFLGVMKEANRLTRIRFQELDAEFRALNAELEKKYGYKCRQMGAGKNAYLQYMVMGKPRGLGPAQFTVPVACIGEKGHELHLFTPETIKTLRDLLAKQHPPAPFRAAPSRPQRAIMDAILSLSPQKDIKGPVAAVPLPRGNSLQHKIF